MGIFVHQLVDAILGSLQAESGKSPLDQLPDPLSEQELRVLGLIVAGNSNQEIADSLEIDISGSGDVKTRGRVNQADLTISGSGTIESGSMSTNAADIRVSGSGEVTIWVKETLDIRVSGSGDVSYYGNPQLDVDVSGSGNVIRLGDKE